jgi:hypothetical protein
MVDGNRFHAPHVLLCPTPMFGGFIAACFALWFVSVGIPSPRSSLGNGLAARSPVILANLQRPGRLASVGQ